MAWTNPNAKQAQEQEALAYINKETREAAKENPTVDALAKAVLESAKAFMEQLEEAQLTTQSKTRDGKTTYTDKAVVNVEPATKYNKETREEESLTHKDGSPVYKATAEIKHSGTTLTLTAKEDISDGAKFVAMTASKWDRSEGTPKLNFYKQDAIANAPINRDIKQIAAFAQEQGLIEQREGGDRDKSSLRSFAYEANQYFNANTEKVANENGELVNNAYAKYQNDEYGEKVTIYNHTDNTAVELGVTTDGKPYAVALNFDLNKDFEPRQEGEAPAKAYINKPEDLKEYIELPEIQEAVAQFKFDGVEQDKGKDSKSAEQPKKAKNEVERD